MSDSKVNPLVVTLLTGSFWGLCGRPVEFVIVNAAIDDNKHYRKTYIDR